MTTMTGCASPRNGFRASIWLAYLKAKPLLIAKIRSPAAVGPDQQQQGYSRMAKELLIPF